MCFGGKTPDVQIPATPDPLPTPVDASIKKARSDQKIRAAAANSGSTTATSAMGDTSQASVAYKSLMGM